MFIHFQPWNILETVTTNKQWEVITLEVLTSHVHDIERRPTTTETPSRLRRVYDNSTWRTINASLGLHKLHQGDIQGDIRNSDVRERTISQQCRLIHRRHLSKRSRKEKLARALDTLSARNSLYSGLDKSAFKEVEHSTTYTHTM